MHNEEWMAAKEDIDKRAAPIYPFLLLGGYGLQLFLVFAATLLWQLFAGALGLSEVGGSAYSGVAFQVTNSLLIGVIGFLLGVACSIASEAPLRQADGSGFRWWGCLSMVSRQTIRSLVLTPF